MTAIVGSVVSVQVGKVAPLGSEAVPSGFVKRTVSGPVMANPLGLSGDAQADRRVHGGPDKAVYCYPFEHYARWREATPQHETLLAPGGFGENLTLVGHTEDEVAIGDVFRIGDAIVQVTQPRQPCFKLALRFGDPRMVRAMVRSGLCGWYLRVRSPGLVAANSVVTLLERPNPDWSIARFHRFSTEGRPTLEEMAAVAALSGLARHWRRAAQEALGAISTAPAD
jgi:MOSC domain-containing protein YiiM